jgi:hypothetical protein
MRNYALFLALIFLIAVVNGGGCNIFNDVSDKNSDAAVLDDVKNLANRGLWNDAILKWGLLSPTGQADREAKVLLASAYSGRGGLDIVTLIDTLNTNVGGGATSLFSQLMQSFRGATIGKYLDQIQAETILKSVGSPASARTVDENVMMLFVQFAKLGTLFAAVADTDADGVVDAGYDNCTDHDVTQGREIATAIGIINDCLSAIGEDIAGDSLGDLTAACASYAGMCGITDTGSVDATMERTARTLAGENNLSVGLGVAANNDICEITAPFGACSGAAPNNLCP